MLTIPYGKTHISCDLAYDGLLLSRVDQLKSEKSGLYTALDFGCVWLERALAGK